MSVTPSTNGPDGPDGAGVGERGPGPGDFVGAGSGGGAGRGPGGRFAPGNKLGRGNPLAGRVAELRAALLETVTPADVAEVVRAMIAAAKRGESWAARELLDRVLGRPVELDFLERLELMEAAVARLPDSKP